MVYLYHDFDGSLSSYTGRQLALIYISSFIVLMATPRRTSTRTPVKKAPRLCRVAARIAGLATPGAKRKCPPNPRKRHADLKTPDRWRIFTAYLELCKGKDRLPRGALETLKKRFLHLNLNARTVQRTVDLYKKQVEEDATSRNVRMTRRRASFCGEQGMILTPELAAKLVEINDKIWGSSHARNLQAN